MTFYWPWKMAAVWRWCFSSRLRLYRLCNWGRYPDRSWPQTCQCNFCSFRGKFCTYAFSDDAFASIVLGMGLPTTAKYIVFWQQLPRLQSRVFGTPMLAAHLFIMYFGILADLTPPVAPCSLCGSRGLREQSQRDRIHGCKIGLCEGTIPYIFCYNPGMLMIGASNLEVLFIACTAAIGIASLSFASVGYWMRKSFSGEAFACSLRNNSHNPGLMTDIVGLGLLIIVYFCKRYSKMARITKNKEAIQTAHR